MKRLWVAADDPTYFYGNAPTMSAQVFDNCASGFTAYYLAGATGFTNPWYGYPTAVFTPPSTTTTTTVQPTTTSVEQTTTSATVSTISTTAEPTSTTTTATIDTDNDGISDTEDNCPNKPNGPDLGTCMPGSDKAGATCHSDADCVIGCSTNGTCSLNQEDTEGDGIGDVCDNCPANCNVEQLDADGDMTGDVCDTDPGCGGCSGIPCEQPCPPTATTTIP